MLISRSKFAREPRSKLAKELRIAEPFAALNPRSNFAKELRKIKLEQLLIDTILEGTNPNNAWFAEKLGVSTRTIHTYLAERQERLWGPPKFYLHLHDESGKEVSRELLTIDECAKRLNLTVRELRRQIWVATRDHNRVAWEKRTGRGTCPT